MKIFAAEISLALLMPFCAFAQTQTNTIPITISHANALNTGVTINAPMISVQLCEPGTQKCVTIPNIVLDTGSAGLRLFSAPVGLNLPRQVDQAGNVVSENIHFSEGTCLWGPVVRGDLKLGGDTIQNLPLQLNIGSYPFPPSGCKYPVQNGDQFGFNGILGVAARSVDCLDASDADCASTVNQYYSCSAQSCQATAAGVSQQVINPVAIKYNGFSIAFPSLATGDSGPTEGSLVLGDGAAAKGLKVVRTNNRGAFSVIFNTITYAAVLDSGTAWNFLPGIDSDEYCKMPGITYPPLCPTHSETQSFAIESIDGSNPYTTTVNVGNYLDEIARGSLSSDNLTVSQPDPDHDSMIFLGLSFFYGKTIYFGFDKKPTPYGPGPLFAF